MIIQRPIGILQSNIYLIYDAEKHLGAIVDPGGDVGPLLKEIEQRELKILYNLNTHGHFDHVAGNAQVHKAFDDLPLGLHPADHTLLAKGGGAHWFNLAHVPSPPPTLELVDGLILEVGMLKIQVIHTPGHTPGSVSFYIAEEGALLTGDTLFAGGIGRTDLPGGSARALNASLKKLLKCPSNTKLYPGHGPLSTLSHEQHHNPWLTSMHP